MTDIRHAPLFQELEPPHELFGAILARIALMQRRAARFRLAAFGSIAFISVLLLIPAAQYVLNEFYASGFYDYASLFFDSLSRGYWRELLYSLSDSLPSMSLLLIAAIGSTFVWSLRQTRQNARIAFTRLSISA